MQSIAQAADFSLFPLLFRIKCFSFAKANRLIRYYHQKLKSSNHGRIDINQSDCITIKDYDPETKLFTLDIPNKEAQKALTW